jgi:ABC-type multidrug transport system ATPase subunit
MVRPTAGTATVLGSPVDVPKQNREMRRRIAYVALTVAFKR